MDQDAVVNKGVCRCLFGPVDHEEIANTLSHELERLNLQNQERWNFDFQTERPLDGRYAWAKVGGGPDVGGEGLPTHKQEDLPVGGSTIEPISKPKDGLTESDQGNGLDLSGTARCDLHYQQGAHVRDDIIGDVCSGGEPRPVVAAREAAPSADTQTSSFLVSPTPLHSRDDTPLSSVAAAPTESTVASFTHTHLPNSPFSQPISATTLSVSSDCGILKRKPQHITGA